MNRIKTCVLLLSALVLTALLGIPLEATTTPQEKGIQSLQALFDMPLEKNEAAFMSLGPYSNMVVRVGDITVLFDPATLKESDLAVLNEQGVNLVVYTHEHYDHYSSDTALQLFKGSQPYIAVGPSLAPFFKGDIPQEKLIATASGQSSSAGDIKIEAIAGKHIGDIMLFRITINGIKIFHGGDSAYVPLQAMASDLAFVPTGSPSPTCSPEYAFQMVLDLKPQIAVPMHGITDEHEAFKNLTKAKMPGTKVIIPTPNVCQKVSVHH